MIDFNQLCREPSKVAATLQFELVPSIQARIAAVLLALSARLEWDLTYKRAQSYGPEEIDFNALMRGPMALRTLPPRFIPAVQEKLAAVLVALSQVMEAHAFRQGTTQTPMRLTRDNDRMLTLKEAAEILSVSTSWVRDHVPCVKRLGTGDRAPVRISKFELRAWIRQQHTAGRSTW